MNGKRDLVLDSLDVLESRTSNISSDSSKDTLIEAGLHDFIKHGKKRISATMGFGRRRP